MTTAPGNLIEATDLSPIEGVTPEVAAWLAALAQAVDVDTITLRLSPGSIDNAESVIDYDTSMGRWFAGRYVGEIQYLGQTLRILPRFGMPQLQRWLSRIWGIRVLESKGSYARSHTWLWELLAALWASRLLAAAKHGLPTRRVNQVHRSVTMRGRLAVQPTSVEFGAGRKLLVSESRNRVVDDCIGGVILAAFQHLRRELRHLGDERLWLPPRALNLVSSLRSQIDKHAIAKAGSRVIRYTPITESYRAIVDLSLAITRQQPLSPSQQGSRNVFGVLIDMAEVWELYVYHLLRSLLIDEADVVHTGRSRSPDNYLLSSSVTNQHLGGLLPDIMIRNVRTGKCLAVVDAKYKTTLPGPGRPYGVVREDLYQMAAYIAAYRDPARSLPGALVFPGTKDSHTLSDLHVASPWRLAKTDCTMSFLGLDCEPTISSTAWTPSELELGDSVRQMIAARAHKVESVLAVG